MRVCLCFAFDCFVKRLINRPDYAGCHTDHAGGHTDHAGGHTDPPNIDLGRSDPPARPGRPTPNRER